jgi:hypothetical protein
MTFSQLTQCPHPCPERGFGVRRRKQTPFPGYDLDGVKFSRPLAGDADRVFHDPFGFGRSIDTDDHE